MLCDSAWTWEVEIPPFSKFSVFPSMLALHWPLAAFFLFSVSNTTLYTLRIISFLVKNKTVHILRTAHLF